MIKRKVEHGCGHKRTTLRTTWCSGYLSENASARPGGRFCANVRVVDRQCRAMKTTLVPIVTCLFLEEGSIRSPFDGRVVAC